MRTETPVAVSYVKRYYFAQGGRGYSLTFEAREDVFPRVSRWADYIASTLRFGERGGAPRSERHARPPRRRPRPPPARPRPPRWSRWAPEGPGGRLQRASARRRRRGRPTLVQGRPCLRPDRVLLLPLLRPARGLPAAGGRGACGSRSSTTAPATASSGCSTPRPTGPQPWDGLYKAAEQRWQPEAVGLRRFRRAVFHLPDFDPGRTQNQGASFRLEFRRELLVSRVAVSLAPPAGPRGLPGGGAPARAAQDAGAPLPRSTTSSSRSRTRATSSARGAPTRSWAAAAAS